MLWIRSAIFLTIPDLRRENPAGTLLKTSVQSGTVAVFTIKTPLCFCLVRNCERNVYFGKAEIDRSSSRIEYTGDTGYGILMTRRNLSEKQGIRNLMLMPEMKLFEQSEFSSQVLLLIRFRIPCFSKIPERIQNSISGISVLFYSELLNIFLYF